LSKWRSSKGFRTGLLRGVQQGGIMMGAFLPDETVLAIATPRSVSAHVPPMHQMHGQCVEHLVGHNRTAEFFRPRRPASARAPADVAGSFSARLLARAQVGAHLQDRVAVRQVADRSSSPSMSAASLRCPRPTPEFAAAGCHDLRHLPRQECGRTAATAPAQ